MGDFLILLFVIGFVVMLIVLVLSALVSANVENEKKSTSTSRNGNYEDPMDGAMLKSHEEKERPEIFQASNPFFYALQQDDFIYSLDDGLIPLARSLAAIKDRDIQQAISQLAGQDYFRTKTGLPKYLQMVPIRRFIREGIFIEPDENHKEEFLSSKKMKELRAICDDVGVQGARSKAETVERLLKSGKPLDLGYNKYFKINPDVERIFEAFNGYCEGKIIEQYNKKTIAVTTVDKPLIEDELGESEKQDGYKLQAYGYQSAILFKGSKPIYRVYGYTVDDGYGARAKLLDGAKVFLYDDMRLGRTTVAGIAVIDENRKPLYQNGLLNPSHNSLKYLPEQNVVCCNKEDDTTWILDVETMEDKELENPEGKNIYALLEEA